VAPARPWAAAQGCAAETLVQEAVERLLNYDDRLLCEVDKGLAAADRGEFVEHEGKIQPVLIDESMVVG
jgi:predicted transcriptional regulator